MRYNKCPICESTMSAHKGHTKTFAELSPEEKNNSIRMMTINLKRAIIKHSGNTGLLWAINYLSKK